MKHEKLIVEFTEAIEARLNALAEAGAELWECYITDDCAVAMARAAVAILEAHESQNAFAKLQEAK